MRLRMVGCSHKRATVQVRERLAFSRSQTVEALDAWRELFPGVEAVLLSTCNRVELYTATGDRSPLPATNAAAHFLASCRRIPADWVSRAIDDVEDQHAVRHLFGVAASVDSMVVGEPQILAQVKEAYDLAEQRGTTGPLTHGVFQAAVRTARRVANETTLHRRRVSIPSIAVAEFAMQVFERFDDKRVLVAGAGEMAEETLQHLVDHGARQITITNRNAERAQALAERWDAHAQPWQQLWESMIAADVMVSATGATEPIVSVQDYRQRVAPRRDQRPFFILDVAVPRDIDPQLGEERGIYLYCIDDLAEACERNLAERRRELPVAERIIAQEAEKFVAGAYHRLSGPTIERLRERWQQPKEAELNRLINKLGDLNGSQRQEIAQSFDRLINKLLHTPLESLRDQSLEGPPHGLLDALRRLFRLED